MKTKEMDEIAVVLKRFGDEQSTLLDQFERLTFEVQLNQAILGRSLSEPGSIRSRLQAPLKVNGRQAAPQAFVAQTQEKRVRRRRLRGLRFDKVLKNLLKPILRRKSSSNGSKSTGNAASVAGAGAGAGAGAAPSQKDASDLKSWKAFSRSLRF